MITGKVFPVLPSCYVCRSVFTFTHKQVYIYMHMCIYLLLSGIDFPRMDPLLPAASCQQHLRAPAHGEALLRALEMGEAGRNAVLLRGSCDLVIT